MPEKGKKTDGQCTCTKEYPQVKTKVLSKERQEPTPHRDNDRRRDNDRKANSRIALPPGRCLVGVTVRLPAEVSFFLFLSGWRGLEKKFSVSLLVNV